MATIRLFDANLSGYVEYVTEATPEEVFEQLSAVAGTWWDPTGDGALILSDGWSASYYVGTPDERDPYPDYVIDREEGVQRA